MTAPNEAPMIACTSCGRQHRQLSYLELCGRCLYTSYGRGGDGHVPQPPRLSPRQQRDRQQRLEELAFTRHLTGLAAITRTDISTDD